MEKNGSAGILTEALLTSKLILTQTMKVIKMHYITGAITHSHYHQLKALYEHIMTLPDFFQFSEKEQLFFDYFNSYYEHLDEVTVDTRIIQLDDQLDRSVIGPIKNLL